MIWKIALMCLAAARHDGARHGRRREIQAAQTRDAGRGARHRPRLHRQQPARMIEVKPGLWISSYGCVTDDGLRPPPAVRHTDSSSGGR